jgi:acyl-CoA synthetase (NDP forming)
MTSSIEAPSQSLGPSLTLPSAAANFGELTPLLAPRSIAVIGASDREGNLGGVAVNFLRKFGYQGAVWPVNAGRTTVAGLPCFASLADLPGTPDLAIIAVPAESVVDVASECAAAGIPAALVWAGGFAEQDEAGTLRPQLYRHHQHIDRHDCLVQFDAVRT